MALPPLLPVRLIHDRLQRIFPEALKADGISERIDKTVARLLDGG